MLGAVSRFETRQVVVTARPRDLLVASGSVALVHPLLDFGRTAVLQYLFEQADHGPVMSGAGHRVEPDLEEHPQGLCKARCLLRTLRARTVSAVALTVSTSVRCSSSERTRRGGFLTFGGGLRFSALSTRSFDIDTPSRSARARIRSRSRRLHEIECMVALTSTRRPVMVPVSPCRASPGSRGLQDRGTTAPPWP